MSSPVSPPLTVTTVGGTPSGRPITTIKVSNGDLSISGDTATIDTSGSGGGGSVTSITFSSPLTGGTITTSGTVGIPEADGSTDGYLSSTAYNTFDGKQDAITLTTTGSSGVATFTAGTLNIPNYTNSATIGGSIANSQVAYGSGANTIQGSANLTFDGTNLSVGGYVKSGTGVYDTDGATDLTLQTNSGTDTGKIVIFDGAGQDIEITPNGGGVINLDGLKWPSADGSANQVLQTDGAGTLSFATVSGGGGIGGSITDNQVAVGATTANDIEGSSNLTFDASTGRLVVSERISSSGTGALTLETNNGLSSGTIKILNGGVANHINITPASGTLNLDAETIRLSQAGNTTLTTAGAYDLTLNTNDGTNSGSITIFDGAGQDIEITPNGAGVINLDGLKWPGADGSANQVLQTDGAGTLSFATVSGGGSPGGSDTYVQYNDSSSFGGSDRFKFDPDVGGSGNAGMGLKINGSAFVSNGFVAYIEGNGYISGQVFGNEFLCSSSSSSDVGFGPSTDQNTGIAFSAADQVDIVTGAAYNVSFGSSKEILLGGTDAGTSGQVLTSGGSGAAVTWGGAGSGFKQPAIATGTFLSTANKYPCFTSAPYGTSQIITTDTSADYDTNPCMRPFVLAEGGTWGGVAINVQTASSANAILISLYNSDSDGMPSSFVGYCEVATTSTGNITQTTTLDSGGSSATITLTKDTQYWCSFVSKASSDSYTLMSVAADALGGFGGANMQNEYTLLRNTFVSNDIETTNPPRNTQTLSDRDAPHIGIII